MLTLAQALILGILQGVTELFPISSLGHTVVFPTLVGWRVNQSDPAFLAFIVATHFATALALLVFFRRDWFNILGGLWRSLRERVIRADDTFAKLGWLLVVSSVPVGVLGILFEKQFSALFAAPLYAGVFLIGNGMLLFGAERLIRRRPPFETHSYERAARLSFWQAVKVGLMQSLALFPGFSRTGATLAGGLLVGLSHEDAARYAFLLATPVIFAAALLKIPELALSGERLSAWPFVVGAAAAALGAWLSVRFLTRYFRTKTLLPFAYYCIAVGALAVAISLFG